MNHQPFRSFKDRWEFVTGGKPYEWARDRGLEKGLVTSLVRIKKRPQRATLQLLEEKTGIPAEWWLHGNDLPPSPATGSGEWAPRVQSAVADYQVTDASPRVAPRADLRDLPQVLIEDDAMEPLIPNGWWGLIEWTRDKPDQAGIYAMLLDGKLAVRRLDLAADGGLVLTCENPAYPGRTLSPEDASKLMVFGRVVFVGRPL